MSIIRSITRETLSLKRILCTVCEECKNSEIYSFEEVIFEFENELKISVTVDSDNDEIILRERKDINENMVDVSCVYPIFSNFYGCVLLWSWEMRNHQGYFDALQLEFWDKNLKKDNILQLKVYASLIYIFTVNQL